MEVMQILENSSCFNPKQITLNKSFKRVSNNFSRFELSIVKAVLKTVYIASRFKALLNSVEVSKAIENISFLNMLL